jgi:UDP:flavonoid glycosyltransferase YjiC (YdhE family)
MKRTIAVCMLQETGHLNPTFKLLRELAARGHTIRYFAVPDLGARIEEQGFAVEPWFPELFPRGFADRDRELGRLAFRRRVTARFVEVSERLLAGRDVAARLVASRPDLLLVDVNEPRMALLAGKLAIRIALLNTSLPQTRDPGVPPIRSGRAFAPGALGRLKAGAEWAAFTTKRRVSAELASVVGARPPYDVTRRLAPRFGVTTRELDTRTTYMPQPRGRTELVLCPEAFDFPRPPAPSRHYVESVDLQRRETPLELALDERPLIFCSLGTQVYRPHDTPRFLRTLVQVFTTHPEWRLLLSIVRHPPPDVLGPLPPNVTIVRGAPQLAVLRKAKVMITHGGLGSIKECVLLGVPMLVVPLDIDQPGNAARAEYHRIGVRADVRRATQQGLGDALGRLLAGACHEPLQRMKAAFEAVERSTRGADLLERLLETADP